MAPAGQIVRDFTIARINLTIGAHAIVQRMRQGQPLLLARDRKDPYDPANAIMVIVANPGKKFKVGYLPSGLAKELAPLMDAGVNVIARKAQNPLYGVCQVAWIPPTPTAPDVEEALKLQTPKVATPPAIELPEGVTQQDIDTATDLPPLGDSRRPRKTEAKLISVEEAEALTKETPNVKPTAATADDSE